MAELEIRIKSIQAKLQQLLKEYNTLLKENQRLEKELAKTSELAAMQTQQNDQLRQQLEVSKISSGNWNEKDKKEFEKRISSYIREIDQCIVQLSE